MPHNGSVIKMVFHAYDPHLFTANDTNIVRYYYPLQFDISVITDGAFAAYTIGHVVSAYYPSITAILLGHASHG